MFFNFFLVHCSQSRWVFWNPLHSLFISGQGIFNEDQGTPWRISSQPKQCKQLHQHDKSVGRLLRWNNPRNGKHQEQAKFIRLALLSTDQKGISTDCPQRERLLGIYLLQMVFPGQKWIQSCAVHHRWQIIALHQKQFNHLQYSHQNNWRKAIIDSIILFINS